MQPVCCVLRPRNSHNAGRAEELRLIRFLLARLNICFQGWSSLASSFLYSERVLMPSISATRSLSPSCAAMILPSLQVNMRAGHFPPPEDNNIIYLKIPVDVLGKGK